MMESLGRHLILDLMDCPQALLQQSDQVARVMEQAVAASGATMVQPFFHRFAPQGVSGVVIIAQSHFSIHTWPEHGYAAVDIFTCGRSIDMQAAADHLRQGLQAGNVVSRLMPRGPLPVNHPAAAIDRTAG